MTTHISVDRQIFDVQRRGGISRYFVELVRELAADASLDCQPSFTWRWTQNEHALDAGMGRALPARLARPRLLAAGNKIHERLHRRGDVLHTTYYDEASLPGPGVGLHAVTVYDMIPELMPELFPGGNPHAAKLAYVRAADLVLCISESTAMDLRQLLGSCDATVAVTPLGVGRSFRPGLPLVPGWPCQYVLFVGNRETYKDFQALVVAFGELAPHYPDLYLMAVGGGPVTAQELRLIERSGITSRLRFERLPDGLLPCAYGNALAFVFPSRYEGFGLPTLEAMASGCPTVLARTSSHPEVGGSAARYFPAADTTALAEVLHTVVRDEDLRKNMSEEGIRRAGAFTWKRTAELTAQAYKTALHHKRAGHGTGGA